MSDAVLAQPVLGSSAVLASVAASKSRLKATTAAVLKSTGHHRSQYENDMILPEECHAGLFG
jgi:hypothetical protein